MEKQLSDLYSKIFNLSKENGIPASQFNALSDLLADIGYDETTPEDEIISTAKEHIAHNIASMEVLREEYMREAKYLQMKNEALSSLIPTGLTLQSLVNIAYAYDTFPSEEEYMRYLNENHAGEFEESIARQVWSELKETA